MSTDPINLGARLDARLQRVPPEILRLPGTAGYAAATQPDNSSFVQTPAAVLQPRSADDLATAVRVAGEAGARILVQATGHGSGRTIGADTVIVDTAELNGLNVDSSNGIARVGSGVTWGQLQQRAEIDGLLGLQGTSATVGVAGYTFAGGVGWLARPHGLAAGSLRGVTYVDGTGNVRRAADDSPNSVDREAIWAFRGGAPAGIAAELELSLFSVSDLWAGHLLWPAEHAQDLLSAWSDALPSTPDSVTSTISMLHVPPEGPFPERVLDSNVVHLSYASTAGEEGLTPIRDALRRVADPIVDSTGPANAERLSQIHLDPPAGVPARGTGFWLDETAVDIADRVFAAARIGEPDGLNMIELRHVDSNAPAADGAMARAPAPFLLHAVGVADSDSKRAAVDCVLQHVQEAAAPAAIGRSAPSFREGQPGPGVGNTAEARHRLAALANTLDPDQILQFQRAPTDTD